MKGLELWEKVEKTDPAHTKPYKGKGGFSGTAIKPIYLIKKATELWGPMGSRWGVKVLSENVYEGCPILAPTGVIGHEKLHSVLIELRYPINDSDTNGLATVQSFGHTLLCGVNKNGYFTDDEAPKKSMTDAIGNALHRLGFSADIYFGHFDGNKYDTDTKPEAAPRQAGSEPSDAELGDQLKASIEASKAAKEVEDRIGKLTVKDTSEAEKILTEIAALANPAQKERRKQLLRDKVKELGWLTSRTTENGVDVVKFSIPADAS